MNTNKIGSDSAGNIGRKRADGQPLIPAEGSTQKEEKNPAESTLNPKDTNAISPQAFEHSRAAQEFAVTHREKANDKVAQALQATFGTDNQSMVLALELLAGLQEERKKAILDILRQNREEKE